MTARLSSSGTGPSYKLAVQGRCLPSRHDQLMPWTGQPFTKVHSWEQEHCAILLKHCLCLHNVALQQPQQRACWLAW